MKSSLLITSTGLLCMLLAGPRATDAQYNLIPGAEALDFDPDAYEPDDNAPETGTFLPANDIAQQHTIHQMLDEDWYRLLLDGRTTSGIVEPIPYTLRLANVVLPAGTSLQVSIALDGMSATLPAPADCISFEDTLCATVNASSREIVLLTNGVEPVQPVLVRVALLGTPQDPEAPVSYDIDLYRATGPNNGIIASIGTVTDNRRGLTRPVGYVVLNAGGSFVSNRPSTWSDIQAVRLNRCVIRNDDIVSGPTPVGEWPKSQALYQSCTTSVPPPPQTFQPAILFEDNTLDGVLEDGDLVAYFVSVVIGGTEVPADMFLQPAGAVYIQGVAPSIPGCLDAQIPELEVTPLSVSRGALPGQPIPDAILQISNTGTGVLQWSALSSASWLQVGTLNGNVSGGDSQPVNLTFNRAGLQPADTPYTATVTINATDIPSSAIINVTLTLTPCNDHWVIQ